MAQPLRLAGKRALVTGVGRGIGAAVVRRLAAEGATVAVNYRSDAASADALVDEVRGAGGQAAAFQADVSDPAQIKELVARVIGECGGLDLLASNATTASRPIGPADRSTVDSRNSRPDKRSATPRHRRAPP